MQTRKERSLARKNRQHLTPTGEAILQTFLKAIVKLKRYPNKSDLALLGYKREVLRDQFGSMEKLKAYVAEHYPETLDDITEERIRAPKKARSLKEVIKKSKRFVITSAVEGGSVHSQFKKVLIFIANKTTLNF